MTLARPPRRSSDATGPERADHDDIAELNRVFSDAFTERYRKDGMTGVRVPQLNPVIWRYAMDDADGGALIWRNELGEVIAFNIAHQSGAEGWMGPLAVHPDWQGVGLGKAVVRAGADWLAARQTKVIGLETMPRTMDNIGFYSTLGFVPARLTITVTLDAASADAPVALLSRLPSSTREDLIAACSALTTARIDGYDYAREIRLTTELGLGDTVLLDRGGRIRGFAIFHSIPLVEGRPREELRVLKMVVEQEDDLDELTRLLSLATRRTGTRRLAIRSQGDYPAAYRRLVRLGARVRWTDLRMALASHPEPVAESGVVYSNWEI
ncbi:MAG TPA: GNAT family N-acetyltransferase [Gemmatimonadaceae bacterium]|nr:GNAT family N-acetyltransferase [Gemmatimonadaceae bacterium]